MNKKSGNTTMQVKPKKNYQSPRLMAFGKIHTIVAAGTGPFLEGMLMIGRTRRA